MFAVWISFFLLSAKNSGAEGLSDQDVVALNTRGVCPVGRVVLAPGGGAKTQSLPDGDPVAGQWSGRIDLKPGQTIESAGLPAVAMVTLTCRARIASRGVLKEAVGDLIIHGDRFIDALGEQWRANIDARSKLLSLTPLAGYADRAAVENDAPTLLPVGYLFKTDWSNRLVFIKRIGRQSLWDVLKSEKAQGPAPAAQSHRRTQRKTTSKDEGKRGGGEKSGPIPQPVGIPMGTSPEAKFEYYAKNSAVFKQYHDTEGMNVQELIDAFIQLGLMPSRGQEQSWTPSPFPTLKYKAGFRWPLDAGIVSSEFGRRWGRNHDGIDVAAMMHEPVYASADGQVVYANHTLHGYGNAVMIRHDAKTVTMYAHNTSLLVHEGEWVHQSQLIALVGSTGHSTGPHVHFEIRIAGHPINPRQALPPTRF